MSPDGLMTKMLAEPLRVLAKSRHAVTMRSAVSTLISVLVNALFAASPESVTLSKVTGILRPDVRGGEPEGRHQNNDRACAHEPPSLHHVFLPCWWIEPCFRTWEHSVYGEPGNHSADGIFAIARP